ncbi:hypothetical protein EDD80_11013 [Anseongella ginsenosidimutans]|uniref:Uncharacterized protein n=1 Tax=Anseongella ginsenosidimutans TaxID=496056 RepID=A0A4V2UTF9_9SPHI|nr:hypothetical protein EDD80_11013 [Anseongella ginsenosidimutans]
MRIGTKMVSAGNKSNIGKTEPNQNKKVKDYGNDPYFVKKAADSKIFLEKHGFPEELLLKK